MSIITRMLKQRAVYWPLSTDVTSGQGYSSTSQRQYASPVEIACRWVDETREFSDNAGDLQTSRAVVKVDRDLSIGGVLWLGTLDAVTSVDAPLNNAGAGEIRGIRKLPNLRATQFVRTAFL